MIKDPSTQCWTLWLIWIGLRLRLQLGLSLKLSIALTKAMAMAKTMAVVVATARAMVMASTTDMAKAIMVVTIRWGIAQTRPRRDGMYEALSIACTNPPVRGVEACSCRLSIL